MHRLPTSGRSFLNQKSAEVGIKPALAYTEGGSNPPPLESSKNCILCLQNIGLLSKPCSDVH